MAVTTRRENRYPVGATAPPDVPAWMLNLATDLDDVAYHAKGTLAARPAVDATAGHNIGVDGSFYHATDTEQVFMSDGTQWVEFLLAPQPQVQAVNAGPISIPTTSSTVLPLPNENYDSGTSTEQHSTSTNTSRLTCRKAGLYLINSGFEFWVDGNNTAGTGRYHRLLKNGSEIARDNRHSAGGAGQHQIHRLFRLAVSDYVEAEAFHNAGATLSVYSAFLEWVRVGP